MNPILIQMIYYMVVMILTFFLVGLLERGFFFQYVRVKLSFGRFILVKIRAINRDYFRVGKVIEGFLVFKSPAGQKRISLDPNTPGFYRVMGTTWIDLSDETNAVVKPDFSVASGFDAVKYNSLYLRALYKPAIADNTTKILIAGMILILVGLAALGFVLYKQSYNLEVMAAQIANIKTGVVAGSVV